MLSKGGSRPSRQVGDILLGLELYGLEWFRRTCRSSLLAPLEQAQVEGIDSLCGRCQGQEWSCGNCPALRGVPEDHQGDLEDNL